MLLPPPSLLLVVLLLVLLAMLVFGRDGEAGVLSTLTRQRRRAASEAPVVEKHCANNAGYGANILAAHPRLRTAPAKGGTIRTSCKTKRGRNS
jgi:hypothetical protein